MNEGGEVELSESEKGELFRLLMSFNQKPSFPLARHIWLRCYRLGIDPPQNIINKFIEGLSREDNKFKLPLVASVEEAHKLAVKELRMLDIIDGYIKDKNSSKSEAIQHYCDLIREEGKEKESGYDFENVKKKYARLNSKIDDYIKKQDNYKTEPYTEEHLNWILSIDNEYFNINKMNET